MNGWLILDCFVDEPACFGVPPFISPYPRYIYGALADAGAAPGSISYVTIDALRESGYLLSRTWKCVFVIGGAVVPGRYLGAEIGTTDEIVKIVQKNPSQRFVIGGLVCEKISIPLSNALQVRGDIESAAYEIAHSGSCGDSARRRSYEELNRWAVLGAQAVYQHPDYAHLVAEIETYRGCPRTRHCSFCSEALFKKVDYREQSAILEEIDTLISCGVSRFRIGRQADILAYKSNAQNCIDSFPEPVAEEVVSLFDALYERRASGMIRRLNIDNGNPGTIVNFPDKSHAILRSIARAVSPGDTLPLGVESFDPAVIAMNNLKVDAARCIEAVRIVNDAGGYREEGVCKLLPGINLIHGLAGETKDTFKINFEALAAIADAGLLLKRINIRSLIPLSGDAPRIAGSVVSRYRYFREKIRNEIDAPMLKKLYPLYTVLGDMRVEETRFDVSYLRQLASYAIAVKVYAKFPLKSIMRVAVAGYAERSLTGIPVPFEINRVSAKLIESLPGIGKRAASDIVLARPFANADEIKKIADLSSVMENSISFTTQESSVEGVNPEQKGDTEVSR